MTFRSLALLFMVLAVSACSSKDTTEGELADNLLIDNGAQTSVAPENEYRTEDTSYESEYLAGPAPGTQQDLIVNVGDRIFFGYDRYDLTAEAMSQLEQQARWLKQYTNLSVTVEGHADERGTREYNLALGERRATSVRNYLVAMGVNPSRINVLSYGKERPAVLGSDPQAWAQNRRSVTVVE